ncbi:MAG: hypothetical protein WCD81_00690 [Candidatus Bathyarchaeia archaeon]
MKNSRLKELSKEKLANNFLEVHRLIVDENEIIYFAKTTRTCQVGALPQKSGQKSP